MVLALLMGCGSSGGADESEPVAAGPQGKAESASVDGVHSGELEIWLSLDRFKPGQPEGFKTRILGNFSGLGEEGLPQFDMAVQARGSLAGRSMGVSGHFGGLLLDSDYAVANYENQTYQPDKATFEEIKSKLEEAQQPGDEGNALACVEAAEGLSLGSIAHDFKRLSGKETLDGEPLTWIEAEIDVAATIDALIQLMEDPTCGTQLQAVGVPPVAWLEAAKRSLAGKIGVKQGQVTFDKDGVIRELVARVRGKNSQGESIHVELHVKLLQVNVPESQIVTHGYAPFQQLLKKVGLDEAMLAQADGGEILTGFFKGIVDMVTGREGS